MKWLALTVLILAAAWLQVSFWPAVRPLGVIPNGFLVVAVALVAFRPNTQSLGAVMAGGFLLDMASGSDFGLRTAFYAVLSLVLLSWRQTGVELDRLPLLLSITAL